MNVWWLATSKNEGHCSYNELKYRKVLAQGWPALGDLSMLWPVSDGEKFISLINQMVDYVYPDWEDSRNPGRILLNLFSFKEGDLVVCTEGRSVMGMAKVGENPTYYFDDGHGSYEYAQTISPIGEWRDWDKALLGDPPSPGTMGPTGVTHVNKHWQLFIDAWAKMG